MRVLVTGGTGYLGRAVVTALAARGHEPVIFARSATDSNLPGTIINGDVRNAASLAKAAEGCDAMCHMAAMVSLWQPMPTDFDEVNVNGLKNVLAARDWANAGKIVYTSSFLARPPAGRTEAMMANDYQRTKVLADRIAAEAAANGAPIVRLYPGVIYGPGRNTEGNLIGRLVRDHLAGKLPGVVGADRPWSYAWIDHVADAHVTAIEKAAAGSSYTLGGINAPQMKIFEIVKAITGRPLPRRLSFGVASLAAMLEEAKTALTGKAPLITRGAVNIFREDWSLDSADAQRDLGYQLLPLEQGVAALVASL